VKWIAVALIAAAGLSAADLSPEQWREDIAYLARELPAKHKNLFFHLSKAEFDRQIGGLQEAANTATDIQMRAGLARLVASVGDLHTGIDAFYSSRNFGMGFFEYPDGIFCSSVRVELAEAMSARLVAVQGVPVAQVMERLRQFVPQENEMGTLALTTSLLGRPGGLLAAGVPIKEWAADFEMERGGRTFLVHATVPASPSRDVRRAPLDGAFQTPLYQSNRVSRYWFKFLDATRTLYIQYNNCTEDPAKPFRQFSEEVARTIGGQHPARIVVDLRHNGGGNSDLIEPLLAVLKNQHGVRLFAIIGRGTLSAGFMAAHDLKHKAHARLVGEPTGQKPNSYGDVRTFELPNSRLVVSYSTKYFRMADRGDPPSYAPDHTVLMTSADLQSGRDPIMDWIERQ
jgi:hypothetical protein